MAGFFEPENHSQKTRIAFTGSMKNKIKELIGKCEYCNTKKKVNLLEIHHISEVAKATGTTDKNTPGNLIVLCKDHHKLAHDGEITKISLKSKVAKRSEQRKTELRAILRGRDKISDNGGFPNSHYPTFKPLRITPPIFKTPKF